MKIIQLLFIAILAIAYSSKGQQFIGSFDLVVNQTNSSGVTRADTIEYFFTDGKTALIIHDRRINPNMRMIFDFGDSTITNLFVLNGKNNGYILPMDEAHWPGMPDSKLSQSNIGTKESVEYTGNSKNIEGFDCKEIEVENSEYNAKMYVTNQLPLSMFQILSYQSVGKGKSRKELDLFEEFGVASLPLILELDG